MRAGSPRSKAARIAARLPAAFKIKCHHPVTLVSVRATRPMLASNTVCVLHASLYVRGDIMAAQQALKATSNDDALGDDILSHVTPKWVDWYRDTMRRQPDSDEARAVKDSETVKGEISPR